MAHTQKLRNVLSSLEEDGRTLTAFQRVLLMTDGTVTDVLEAYVAEPICVVKLAESFDAGVVEELHMGVLDNEQLLQRTVLLQGTDTGTNFIYGDSVIIADRLPTAVIEGLLTTADPIGRLLARNRVETFREIVDVRWEAADSYAHYFDVEPTAPLLVRSYRINVGQRPVMRITERFPIEWFPASSDRRSHWRSPL